MILNDKNNIWFKSIAKLWSEIIKNSLHKAVICHIIVTIKLNNKGILLSSYRLHEFEFTSRLRF